MEKKKTLSARMRELQSQGKTISEIAKIVGKPYRQVYSTLNHKKYLENMKQKREAREALLEKLLKRIPQEELEELLK
jgi:predicted metal-dependent hydrolase